MEKDILTRFKKVTLFFQKSVCKSHKERLCLSDLYNNVDMNVENYFIKKKYRLRRVCVLRSKKFPGIIYCRKKTIFLIKYLIIVELKADVIKLSVRLIVKRLHKSYASCNRVHIRNRVYAFFKNFKQF